jgi:hypothetical protein
VWHGGGVDSHARSAHRLEPGPPCPFIADQKKTEGESDLARRRRGRDFLPSSDPAGIPMLALRVTLAKVRKPGPPCL